MQELIKVGNNKVPIIEWDEKRVITTAQLAEIYETDVNNVQANFSRNQERFIESVHYYILKGADLRTFKNYLTDSQLVAKNTPHIYLWTRRGASRHCKILDTEKAWEQFDSLEEQYFNPQIALPNNYIEALQYLIVKEKEKELLVTEIKVKDQVIGELKPKADYTDRILKNPGLVTTTQIAKDYGMSAYEMNNKLHELKIQFKQSGQWLIYKEYHGMGYTHSETINITRSDGSPDVRMNTKWSQKGRLFLYEKLKADGVIPVIERGCRKVG